LNASNFGTSPMGNGITRLECRFFGELESVGKAQAQIGQQLDAKAADQAGLVTFAIDDIDWDDETRVFIEERTSYSPDSLTGLEANLRFVGPETMESKIFSRLTAWQNWIFQRPNAVSENGALGRYGTGIRPTYDMRRV
jgi:benzoyl-CoA-dihydrodiol lyase